MATVCPTVTEDSAQDFQKQVALISSFAERIHLDFSDGIFSPRRLMNPIQADWPDTVKADLHLMVGHAEEHYETIITLQPYTAIFHAETDGVDRAYLQRFASFGQRVGVALLPKSNPKHYADVIRAAHHVLIFGGHLGYQGGDIDLSNLEKIPLVREINPRAELAWDGGITERNVHRLVGAGITILNVGSAIKDATKPKEAYATIKQIANR